MFAQATKASLKQLNAKGHSKRILIFSNQVVNISNDNTQNRPVEHKANVRTETYSLQAIKQLAKANISPLFVVFNSDRNQLS